jgi:hypothetical protein
MFNKVAWDNDEWILSKSVQDYFKMTFSECIKEFGFRRDAEWSKPPLNGQKITTWFKKNK